MVIAIGTITLRGVLRTPSTIEMVIAIGTITLRGVLRTPSTIEMVIAIGTLTLRGVLCTPWAKAIDGWKQTSPTIVRQKPSNSHPCSTLMLIGMLGGCAKMSHSDPD
mmetsp:Transcript_150287/g.482973  ORF Transcript_150287/g.482973 Transcript_150287/m.482973 type:complete len:107 (-) Transcript_150287:348-668(-)